ncbi:MAG: sugar phosphate isomerase/epimerase [Elusimicrobia bacterium]|nr:sugar phosphate isomerase/epimerase [Candidatus Liberimonas magnetica]
MKISIRAAYPENGNYDWAQSLKIYEEIGFVEVAFVNPELFLKLDNKEVIKPFASLNIKVSSLHLPHFSLVNLALFSEIFKKATDLAKLLDCQDLVIHPSFGKARSIENFIKDEIDSVLEKNGLCLCWETFESKKRVFGGLDPVAQYCQGTQNHGICFDFSHVHKEQKEVIATIDRYLPLIKVFHVSNRIKDTIKQHYPIYYDKEEAALDFKEIFTFLKGKQYEGHLVLEYLYEFHDQLLPDAISLLSFLTYKSKINDKM